MQMRIGRFWKSGVAAVLSLVLLLQVTVPAMAYEPADGIQDTSFSLDNEKSNFASYSDEQWEEVFPFGTFVVEFSQYTVQEGKGDGTLSDSYLGIRVARFGGKTTRCVVEYMITNLTTDEGDVSIESNQVVFEAGEDIKTIPIQIKDNLIPQTDRYFAFTLVDAGEGHIGDFNRATVLIKDDEPYTPGIVTATAPKTVDKGEGKAVVTLRRTQGIPYYMTVQVVTADLSAKALAKAGTDYVSVSQTVTFQPKELEKTVEIPLIHDDEKDIAGKDFVVEVKNPKGGSVAQDSQKLTVHLTNLVPDPSYIKVNSERLEAELGENDQTAHAVVEDTPATQSTGSLSINSTLDTASKLRMFASAMSGRSAMQRSAYTKWEDAPVTVFSYQPADENEPEFPYPDNPYANGNGVFPYFWIDSYSDDNLTLWRDTGVIDANDVNARISTRNDNNLNQYYMVAFNWCNHDTWGTASGTYLQLTRDFNSDNNLSMTAMILDWGSDKLKSQWGYYRLDPTATGTDKETDPQDSWYDFSGVGAINRGFCFSISGRGGLAPTNYFYIREMRYYRAVIPFDRMYPTNSTNRSTGTDSISYTLNNMQYTISLADSGSGGVGSIYAQDGTATSHKGFFVNSDLKVTVMPSGNAIPTALYLKDSAGNVHNQNTSATAATVFFKTDLGYVANINLSTMSTANDSAKAPERYISGRYTNLVFHGTEADKTLGIEAASSDSKNIKIQYYNARHILADAAQKNGKTTAQILDSVVSMGNVTTFFSGSLGTDDSVYDKGVVKFDTITLNPQATLLNGKKVNIKIMGTDKSYSNTSQVLKWSDLKNLENVTIILSDPDRKYLDPVPQMSQIQSIRVTNDIGTNFTYQPTRTLGVGFSTLRFEEIHAADANGSANGGLRFRLDFSDASSTALAAGDTPLYFKVKVKKVNVKGESETDLLSFIHIADTGTQGD